MASEMIERGFWLVLDPMTSRYMDGFDPDQEYEFMCDGWEAPSAFRLNDAHPAMNISGLYYRPRPQ